jgi:hypothetical protein
LKVSEPTCFSIAYPIRKLREINPLIKVRNSKPFPKEEARRLSHYQFKKEFVPVNDDASVRGGMSQLVASTIDFTFVRSITADAYSFFGGSCYDPVSLFLLDLFCYLNRLRFISDFCLILRDPLRGDTYRRFAGIRSDFIPCEATFSNFRSRIGEALYQQIFHALVSLVEKLGLISFNFLATDGTLFPSSARYHGCCCFKDSCASIVVDNIVQKVRDRVLHRIEDPAKIIPGKESRVKIECLNPNGPEDVKRPKISIRSFNAAMIAMVGLTSLTVISQLVPMDLILPLNAFPSPVSSNVSNRLSASISTGIVPIEPTALGYQHMFLSLNIPALFWKSPEVQTAIGRCMPYVRHPKEPTAPSRKITPSFANRRFAPSDALPLSPKWPSLQR